MEKSETFVNLVEFGATECSAQTNCVQSLAWIKISPIELKNQTRKKVFNYDSSMELDPFPEKTLVISPGKT